MASPLASWTSATSALPSFQPSALLPPPPPTALLRRLDDLSQLGTIFLNIFFLTAILSVIPTASHVLTAAAGWKQHALATTSLLAEVMDPLGFVLSLLAAPPRPAGPVQPRRAALVAACAALLMSVDLVFIVGQSTRAAVVATLVPRVAPATARVVAASSMRRGSAGIRYARAEVLAPEAFSRPVVQWTERSDAAFPGEFERRTGFRTGGAGFVVAATGPEKMELVVFGGDGVAIKATVCVRGLNPGMTSLFVPFAWLDKRAVEAAVAALSQATNSAGCDWRVEDRREFFVVLADAQVCKDTMSAEMQRHFTLLLSRLLSARVQMRFAVGEEGGEGALKFLDTGGTPWGERAVENSLPLLGTRQLVPNVVLIILACCFAALSLFRSLCLAQGGRYAMGDFFTVASAYGWDLKRSFATVVVPDATLLLLPVKSSSLPADEAHVP